MNVRPLALAMIALPIVSARAEQAGDARRAYPASCAPAAISPAEICKLAHEIAQNEGVRAELVVSVVRAESRAGRHQTSSKGALGPMQLMPDTARAYEVSDICDPVQNIRGGVRYLRDLLKEFGGDEMNALAAYNAGPQAVYRHRGVPPFKETALYVVSIMNQTKAFRGRTATVAHAEGASTSSAAPADWVGGQVLNLADEPRDGSDQHGVSR